MFFLGLKHKTGYVNLGDKSSKFFSVDNILLLKYNQFIQI